MRLQVSPGGQETEQNDPHVSTGGKNLAMRKIDELNDAVDHGVTQGNQRVYPAEGQPVDQLLDKKLHLPRVSFMSVAQALSAAPTKEAAQHIRSCGPVRTVSLLWGSSRT